MPADFECRFRERRPCCRSNVLASRRLLRIAIEGRRGRRMTAEISIDACPGPNGPDAMIPPDLIDLRNHGQFLHVLEVLNCSLALSRRPSGVACLASPTADRRSPACLLPRSMGMAVFGNRLAIATTRELMIFANASTLAALYPKRPDHYDAIFVPRQSYYTGYCDLHDMAFDKNIVLAVNTRFSCLSVIDGYFNFTPIWQPPFVTDFTGDDRLSPQRHGLPRRQGCAIPPRSVCRTSPTAGARGWRRAAS